MTENATEFSALPAIAAHLRDELERKHFILLYAYNSTGKTRLSTAFKEIGKRVDENGVATARDTLYFNAFTEDLFRWDNDLEHDQDRVLELNDRSRFFDGLRELEMESKIGALLERYADFSFYIDNDRHGNPPAPGEPAQLLPPAVAFFRERDSNGNPYPIKVSRGEENIFIWCFFLAIVQLVLDGAEAYRWVKYIYIDDPVSALDEHNVIVVADHLVQLYRDAAANDDEEVDAHRLTVRTVISTHLNLFFNVVHYELKGAFRGAVTQYVLGRDRQASTYRLTQQRGDTPAFHHVAALIELDKVARGAEIHTYHFNMLRAVMEKTALFLGYTHFSACIKTGTGDADGTLRRRFVDLLSHGKYSLYQPMVMEDDTRVLFRQIVRAFLDQFPYNKALFPVAPIPDEDPTP